MLTILIYALFQVGYVNFTWKSGVKKYYYNFDRLQSFDEKILEPPLISIKTRGRVPRRPKGNVYKIYCRVQKSKLHS